MKVANAVVCSGEGVDMLDMKDTIGAASVEMLTLADVAKLLNLHRNSVRRWTNLGLLKCYRVGVRGDRRFKAEDVKVFLESSGRQSHDLVADTGQRNGYHA